MDVIYSRWRLSIRKSFIIIAVFVILVILLNILLKKVFYPIYEANCRAKVKSIATKIANDETTNVMEKYGYEDLVRIEKDNNGNIELIDINIFTLNKIVDEITSNVYNAILKYEEDEIFIRLGAMTGIEILSGYGPKVKFKIDTSGNFSNNIKSEFYSAGFNQTIHRIYLEIIYDISIMSQIKSIKEEIISQVLLTESVIVGDIPSNYIDADGS